MLIRKKGTASHKMIGRGFIAVMIATAISSFFIREINNGSLSWIHIFVPITFFASWEAVHYIRKGNVKRHKRAVIGLFLGRSSFPDCSHFYRDDACGCCFSDKAICKSCRKLITGRLRRGQGAL